MHTVSSLKDTFVAGPEVKIDFYLQERTFITLQFEYRFSLQDNNQSKGVSNNGELVYTLGTGFNS
jgi:hypothetical protein